MKEHIFFDMLIHSALAGNHEILELSASMVCLKNDSKPQGVEFCAQDSSQPNQGQSDAMAASESASEGENRMFFFDGF